MNKFYYKDGLILDYHNKAKILHREDGPAFEKDGNKKWYLNGVLHRLDGPAIQYKNGSRLWFVNGVPHREELPAVVLADGTLKWYINGCLHRLDGPASKTSLSEGWYFKNRLHRIDGPALVYVDGRRYYFIDGAEFETEKLYRQGLEEVLKLPLELRLLDHREWVRNLATFEYQNVNKNMLYP